MSNNKSHWESIYTNKPLTDVSWYQPTPALSLRWIQEALPSKDAAILDVGGGDSFLVDHLLAAGYGNVSVLDISEAAIDRAKVRLGRKADQVKWMVEDIVDFRSKEKYDLWHDRAAFHFLTADEQVASYKQNLLEAMPDNGQLIVGTFSESGPDRCSGINIKKYAKEELAVAFGARFETVQMLNEVHPTPFDTTQNFSFVHLKYKS